MSIKSLMIGLVGATVVCLTAAFYWPNSGTIELHVDASVGLESVRVALGAPPVPHALANFNPDLAKVGEQLIVEGKSSTNQHKGKRISSHFQCTDCHNLKKEGDHLTLLDPQMRLDYVVQNGMPFLPGSTLHGLYNRTDFYNDDYFMKYGDLVISARNDLRAAVQLCAEYCASGRPLEDWELEAMMHYFKREELKIGELGLTSDELVLIQTAVSSSDKMKEQALAVLNEKYVTKYRATFTGTQVEEKRGYGANGNAVNGKKIYDASCLFCHKNARVTYLDLDNDQLSGQFLWNNRKGYDDHSIYQVVRWGTYPKAGRKQYMPLYTNEKLSETQLEDLVAYIKELAGK